MLIGRQRDKTHHYCDGRRGDFRPADLPRSFCTATNNCSPTNGSSGSDNLLASLSIVSLVIRRPSWPPDFSPTDLQTCSGCLLVPSRPRNECEGRLEQLRLIYCCSPATLACRIHSQSVTSACPQCNEASRNSVDVRGCGCFGCFVAPAKHHPSMMAETKLT